MQTLAVIASAWHWNLAGLLVCGIVLALFLPFALRSSRTLAWLLIAGVFLAALVCSPLDVLARHYLLTAEMIEQMLIALVASYLLILAIPENAIRLRIPYPVAWTAGMAVLSLWHLRILVSATLANDAVRGSEYAILLAAGVVFWWPIHAPVRKQRLPLMPRALLYLAAALVWCSILGLILAFEQPSELYLKSPDTLHIASSLASDWSFDAANDQQTAGLLFWIGSAAVLLSEVMAIYYRWYNSPEVRHEFKTR